MHILWLEFPSSYWGKTVQPINEVILMSSFDRCCLAVPSLFGANLKVALRLSARLTWVTSGRERWPGEPPRASQTLRTFQMRWVGVSIWGHMYKRVHICACVLSIICQLLRWFPKIEIARIVNSQVNWHDETSHVLYISQRFALHSIPLNTIRWEYTTSQVTHKSYLFHVFSLIH